MWEKRYITEIAELIQTRPVGHESICVDLEHVSPTTGQLIGGYTVTGKEVSKLRFEKSDVLFAKLRPYLKKAWLSDRSGICSSEFWIFRAKTDLGDPSFIRQFVLSENFLKACAASSGSKMPRADWSYVESVRFPLPPLAEQRKIAEILRTWDEAIEAAEAELKALQELASGVLRAAFSEESELSNARLSELIDIKKGDQLNRENTFGVTDGYPVWNGGITPTGLHSEFNTEGPAVIISEGGNSCGTVTWVDGNFWRGGHCYLAEPLNAKDMSLDYLYALLKYHEARIMKLRVGSGLPNVQKKSLMAYRVGVHGPDLQLNVAKLYTLSIERCKAAEEHVHRLRTQKRGLMQKLLTGEVRVTS